MSNTTLTPAEILQKHFPIRSFYGGYKEKIIEMLKDHGNQRYEEGKADAQEETKITFDLAIEFAEWLYQNRWFRFEDGKWHYTFEMGTSLSRNEYQKNYVKTTQQLLAKFMVQKLPSPPKEQ